MQILLGVAWAVLALWSIRHYGPRTQQRLLAAWLLLAALIYVGFAWRAADAAWLWLECAGVGLFGLLAWIGRRWSARVLALGWAGHVLWDVLLHGRQATPFVPVWYPPVCIGFDLLLAVYLLLGWPRARATKDIEA